MRVNFCINVRDCLPISEVDQVIEREKADQAQNVVIEGVHRDDDVVPLLDQILAMNLDTDAEPEDDNAESEGENAESDSSTQSDLDEILN